MLTHALKLIHSTKKWDLKGVTGGDLRHLGISHVQRLNSKASASQGEDECN